MEYSYKTINLALLEQISYTGKNDFERFLIQQNIIQYLLMALILVRTTFPDKNFRGWIENATLGNLINLYKICVRNEKETIVKLLTEYNKGRTYLVHKMVKDPNYKQLQSRIKEENDIGSNIQKILNRLVIDEYEVKLKKKR